MGFLFSLIFFVFIIGVVILLSVLGFVRSIFGFRRRKDPFPDGRNFNGETNERYNPFKTSKKSKKIIDKDEGEYVDYEEMN
ncbi:hypothetical protein SDC9_61849 [bioreactor metagenome]|jgi:hypothetical protein|uniref:DUF4834 domain-containing protein n=1 Tax=bioreactor metagenome TaxID=1076179 RepID=A0A644XI63_9ZZZZ|nr:DUF4834 family protein [Paludibacter sp.]